MVKCAWELKPTQGSCRIERPTVLGPDWPVVDRPLQVVHRLALVENALQFGARGSLGFALRGLFELSLELFLLSVAGMDVGLLIAARIALWHRHFRRSASSILAIAAIPTCFVIVAQVPLFDPWL